MESKTISGKTIQKRKTEKCRAEKFLPYKGKTILSIIVLL
jgi:hypothetical protein